MQSHLFRTDGEKKIKHRRLYGDYYSPGKPMAVGLTLFETFLG
jgi:hypothetical protein